MERTADGRPRARCRDRLGLLESRVRPAAVPMGRNTGERLMQASASSRATVSVWCSGRSLAGNTPQRARKLMCGAAGATVPRHHFKVGGSAHTLVVEDPVT
jgi:hypothetical protein